MNSDSLKHKRNSEAVRVPSFTVHQQQTVWENTDRLELNTLKMEHTRFQTTHTRSYPAAIGEACNRLLHIVGNSSSAERGLRQQKECGGQAWWYRNREGGWCMWWRNKRTIKKWGRAEGEGGEIPCTVEKDGKGMEDLNDVIGLLCFTEVKEKGSIKKM